MNLLFSLFRSITLRVLAYGLFAAGVALLAMPSCDSTAPSGGDQSQATATIGEFRVAKLEISGMSCHGCAAGIEESLKTLPGVDQVAVSREDRTARVTVRRDGPTGESQLRAAVDNKGYKVTACIWES